MAPHHVAAFGVHVDFERAVEHDALGQGVERDAGHGGHVPHERAGKHQPAAHDANAHTFDPLG